MNTRNNICSLSWIHPVWWFVALFSAILAFIALLNYKNFPFSGLNLFTILWMGSCLLFVHVLVNMKTYIRLFAEGRWIEIPGSIRSDMSRYLPYLLMALLYDNIGLFHDAKRVTFDNFDYYFMKADEFIFGAHPVIVLENYLHPYLVEFFMASYTLFALPYAFLIYLFQKQNMAVFDKALLAQVIASIIALTCFIYLPALGPRYVFDPARTRVQDTPRFERALEGVRIPGLYRATGYESMYDVQSSAWNYLERIKTDCMPSMHTTLYVLCLLFVLRYKNMMRWKRTAIAFWSASCVFLIFSCVYLRYHWVVDVIAGIFVALASYAAAELIIGSWRKSHNSLT